MAIESNSMTLAQYAALSNEPLIGKIVFSLYEFGFVFADVPIPSISSLKVNGSRVVGNLPSINWRKLNEGTAVIGGSADPFSEQVYLLANSIDVDVALLQDTNRVSDPRGVRFEMWLRSLTYDVNDKFINNNPVTGDEDAPVGIRYRLDNPSTYGINSACKIDAAGVNMKQANTADDGAAFFELMDQMLDEIGDPEGNGVVFYMNRLLRRRAAASVKKMGAGGGFDMTQDAFGRRVTTYRNARIMTVGVKADQTTEIITNTESTTGADSNADRTSMYAVKYGESYFTPWQMKPLEAKYIGIRPDEPTIDRTHMDWSLGLYQEYTRAVVRAYNIEVS